MIRVAFTKPSKRLTRPGPESNGQSPSALTTPSAIIVRKSDAEEFKLKTISDAAPQTAHWVAGFGYEFMETGRRVSRPREAIRPAFSASTPRDGPRADLQSVAGRQVDFIAGNSTDGLIEALGLVVLEDDMHYFPPYDAVPLVRDATAGETPGNPRGVEGPGRKDYCGTNAPDELCGGREHRDVKEVVREFLHENVAEVHLPTVLRTH